MILKEISYGEAIKQAFEYLLDKYPNVVCIGQGLWSPWYVGNTMKDLDIIFGKERIIDSPVSELAVTGIAIGASLCGYRPIVIHPRMDFMLLALDQIVNQAAKWHHMLGGAMSPSVTIRGIINRGGEQGAQHSQALHAWFAHIPGLVVVMPATVQDARDLLIASVLSDKPVVYIDDRWLYDRTSILGPIEEHKIESFEPRVLIQGDDITIVGIGYSTFLAEQVSAFLELQGISVEVIDLRVINPLNTAIISNSVKKTGRLLVVDGGWKTAGIAGEVIASIMEKNDLSYFKSQPARITLYDAPAPTSSELEQHYYPTVQQIVHKAKQMMKMNEKNAVLKE